MRGRSQGLGLIVSLLLASLVNVSCGGYRHHKTVESVVAVAWTDDGRPVRLIQEVLFKWDFVGIAPDYVDPTHELGRVAVAVDKQTPVSLRGFEQWWTIDWAITRPHGRGFAIQLDKERQTACMLISPSGQSGACTVPTSESPFVHGSPKHDAVVLGRFRDKSIEIVRLDRSDRVPAELDDLTWRIRLHDDLAPCDMSYSAVSPDESSWVVACRINGQSGLWQVDGRSPANLLVPSPLPSSVAFSSLAGPMEYSVRPFSQQFGLAWSPDAQQIYYCGTNGGAAMVVNVKTKSVRSVEPCVTGAVWSPDGQRVLGVQGDGRMGIVRLATAG